MKNKVKYFDNNDLFTTNLIKTGDHLFTVFIICGLYQLTGKFSDVAVCQRHFHRSKLKETIGLGYDPIFISRNIDTQYIGI